MIQFTLSLASLPQILGIAVILFLGFWNPRGTRRSAPGLQFEISFPSSRPAFGKDFHLVPGVEHRLVPGTEVTTGSRFGLAWSGVLRLVSGIASAAMAAVASLLAAIGLFVLFGIASALLTHRAPPPPVERQASFALPVAMTDADLAMLKAQATLLRSLSPTKGGSGAYTPLEVGTAVAEAMRRAVLSR